MASQFRSGRVAQAQQQEGLVSRMDKVAQDVTGIPTLAPLHLLYVTLLGIAPAALRSSQEK